MEKDLFGMQTPVFEYIFPIPSPYLSEPSIFKTLHPPPINIFYE